MTSKSSFAPSPSRRLLVLVSLIFFLSGACGLVYEVVWLKMLSLVFGVTALAAATVLASFMFAVLLLPTILMGGTLPVMVRFLTRRTSELGRRVSQLYFINTLGAVVGSFATGFFLIAFLGVREAAYAAGAVNVLLAAAAFILDMRLAGAQASAEVMSTVSEPSPASSLSPRLATLTLWAIAISGFCSLAYEVLWTRALVFILDNTAQAFTTMLTAFLFGIAFGSLLVARWIDRSRHLLVVFGVVEVLIAVLAALSIPLFGNLGASLGGPGDAVYPTASQWLWAALRFGRAFLVMLLPTLLMGMTLPLAVRLYGAARPAGSTVGRVYGVNTLGGVAGSFGAGFLLIPTLGVQGSVLLVAGVNALLGVGLILAEPVLRRKYRVGTAAVSAVSYLVVLALLLSSGRIMFFSAIERPALVSVPYYREAVGATVKVYVDAFGDRTLSIDGFPVAGTIPRHQDAQRSLGNFPLLLNQIDKPRLNIVGFGAGGSSWAATLYDTSQIECVELLPAVVGAAGFFPEVNHGVLSNPRLELTIDDGRNHMLLTEETYDIISVDATSPKSAGSGSLYAREFYQSCAAHLSPGGLMVQWLPYHLLSPDDVRMVARTFREVFPHASLWFSFERYYYILVGTVQPLRLDFQRLTSLMGQPAIQEELAPVNIADAYDVLACFIMGEQELGAFMDGGRLNTDDHPYLEYEPASSYLAVDEHVRQNLGLIAPRRGSAWPYLMNIPAGQAQAVQEALNARIQATPPAHFFPQYVG